MHPSTGSFHPVLQDWFLRRFRQPTPAQEQGWPLLQRGVHTLIAAPTGGGKTLAAFFVAIDRLVRDSLAATMRPGIQVLYISPLRALSNDIKKNLEEPLAEITAELQAAGLRPEPLTIGLRTGDSTRSERARLLKHPPHILVTTPESLFLLLSSGVARRHLSSIHTVIVDEIHALARDKRGSHLSLSLAQLDQLCAAEPVRIGLSATQKPLEAIAGFLVGSQRDCKIVDVSQQRDADLDLIAPMSPLGALCSQEMWAEVYEQLAAEIRAHRSTLIFVNTRRMAERITFQLSEMLGSDAVAAHHGSLSKDKRLQAEDRLKRGDIKAIIATSSLELGIDIGTIDLVCQVGSPQSIAAFVQRVGRSGHALGLKPKARLVALTRDELIECLALIRTYRQGSMDSITIPEQPCDILAQHIVSLVAIQEQSPTQIFELVRRAYPYRALEFRTFEQILDFLSEGLSASTRRGAYLHWDKQQDRLRPRRSARLAVLTSGGAIPEQNLYRVIHDKDQSFVGTVDEEFAIESARGDIFLLGNHSWQIQGLKGDVLLVQDREGAPPTIPFWKGEAGGRTFELSAEVARIREEIDTLVADGSDPEAAIPGLAAVLRHEFSCRTDLIEQAAAYLVLQKLALGLLPTQRRIVYERFFDETGGMQLVVHAPFGSRINRAWGLAFRKRFCRGFDFELQAAASNNGLLLSVGPNQSFPLETLFKMLNPQNCRSILVQALLDVPMFEIRWRWNVTRALAVLRSQAGRRVPPHLQRYQANDLLTAVFPAQTQCFEHRTGDLEVPDHPLVQQTVKDCLEEAMDVQRFEAIMQQIERGEIELIARDTREPSPFCYELIHAQPYSFLDDAPLEERRVRALSTRRTLTPEAFRDLSALDPRVVASVSREAWPWLRDQDELYDALKQLILTDEHSLTEHNGWLADLGRVGRVAALTIGTRRFYYAHERLSMVQSLCPQSFADQVLPQHEPWFWDLQLSSLRALLRGHLECRGPLSTSWFSRMFLWEPEWIEAALVQLESEGVVLSGTFQALEADDSSRQWCERRLLQRMHRLTIEGLREQIKPVSLAVYTRFLLRHQHLDPDTRLRGREGLLSLIELLQGWEAPAAVWENELLISRLQDFSPQDLDQLCLSGQALWGRLWVPPLKEEGKRTGQRLFTRLTKIGFTLRPGLAWILPSDRKGATEQLSEVARTLWLAIEARGALFFDELISLSKLLPAQLEDALSELMSFGLVHADSFAAIRPLVNPDRLVRSPPSTKPRQIRYASDFRTGGRFAAFARHLDGAPQEERLEAWAWQLLKRYGVIFRDLVARERLAPSWSELAPIYRTLEARGRLRGGRFIEGVGGEQFALQEAVTELRRIRESPPQDDLIVLAASDPANLLFLETNSFKLAQLSSNRVAVWRGTVVAWKDRATIQVREQNLPEPVRIVVERALRLSGKFRRQDPFSQPDLPLRETKSETPAPSKLLKNWRSYLDASPTTGSLR
jgi:ATP-dependent Lhr-like helicase